MISLYHQFSPSHQLQHTIACILKYKDRLNLSFFIFYASVQKKENVQKVPSRNTRIGTNRRIEKAKE